MATVTIELPEPLATRARDQGLLSTDRLAPLLEAELKRMEEVSPNGRTHPNKGRFDGPLITGIDPADSRAIASDPEFDLANSKLWR